jgi:hypothetical protein
MTGTGRTGTVGNQAARGQFQPVENFLLSAHSICTIIVDAGAMSRTLS